MRTLPRLAAAVAAAFAVSAVSMAPAMASPTLTPATLHTLLQPYNGKWCSKADMGGQMTVFDSGSHAGTAHVQWNSAHACTSRASYPLSVWVRFQVRGHTASRLIGHVISGNRGGLHYMKKGLRVLLKGRPSLRHLLFAPDGLQPGRMCRNPNAAFCAGP